jgi:hypothetical protein
LYLGATSTKVVAAGDHGLPYFGMGRSLPGDKKVLIRQILDALVRAHALELRASRKIRYYEMGLESSRGVQILIESKL